MTPTPRRSGLLVAAPGSSAGKTAVTLLVAAWARAHGRAVQGFKVGPDFIDPQYLSLVTGRPVPSLDPWFLGTAALRRHCTRWSLGSDLVLAEGVMGLFDGKRGAPFGRYSSAEVARILDLPVLLVLNARKAGPTLATQALGLMQADSRVRFCGVVLNQAAGAKTRDLVAPALRRLTGLPVLGWLPQMDELAVPERHLGLTAPSEMGPWKARLDAAVSKAAASLDFAAVVRAARIGRTPTESARALARPRAGKRFCLAVARDEAFHFYYPENLALLGSLGADLAFFSPLRDRGLPPGTQGLLVGGGFPERFGPELAANAPLRQQVRAALGRGLPVWAECGGLMWLCRSLTDLEGRTHAMVGALPDRVRMTPRLQHFGYTTARAQAHPSWIRGCVVKGHEFHHSVLEASKASRSAWSLEQTGRPTRAEGRALPNGLATYFHAYLPSAPAAARGFARACAAAPPW